MLWSKTSFIRLPSNRKWTYIKSLSHVLSFHIISPYTQFADRALFHHALYASLRGSVLLACRLPQRPLLPIGQLPVMILSLLNLKGVSPLDQIPCHSHKWGYWGFLRRFEPQETQPKNTEMFKFGGEWLTIYLVVDVFEMCRVELNSICVTAWVNSSRTSTVTMREETESVTKLWWKTPMYKVCPAQICTSAMRKLLTLSLQNIAVIHLSTAIWLTCALFLIISIVNNCKIDSNTFSNLFNFSTLVKAVTLILLLYYLKQIDLP